MQGTHTAAFRIDLGRAGGLRCQVEVAFDGRRILAGYRVAEERIGILLKTHEFNRTADLRGVNVTTEEETRTGSGVDILRPGNISTIAPDD